MPYTSYPEYKGGVVPRDLLEPPRGGNKYCLIFKIIVLTNDSWTACMNV